MSSHASPRTSRLPRLAGIAGPLVFVANVIIGGWITPGYSHVRHAVSELTQAGCAHPVLLGAPFVLSALLLGAFGTELRRTRPTSRGRAIGLLLELYAAQAVLLATVFPQDPIGAPLTGPGTLHLVLVGVSALCIVGAILLAAAESGPHERWFRAYSLATVAVMFASGASTGVLIAWDIPWLGLVERITQGAYLVWFVVFAVMTAETARPRRSRTP